MIAIYEHKNAIEHCIMPCLQFTVTTAARISDCQIPYSEIVLLLMSPGQEQTIHFDRG